MKNKIGIGIAGLGTVGEGFLKQLTNNSSLNSMNGSFLTAV